MWEKVVIEAGTEVAQSQGCSLMTNKDSYEPLWREAGLPLDAKVYTGKDSDGNHVFYFNELACEIGKGVLDRFKAMECDEPNFDGLKLLK
jgi:hypothetical protein